MLDEPETLNALNARLIEALHQSLTQLAQDPQIRVIVLTSSQPKAFVAGADIASMQAYSPAQAQRFSEQGQALLQLFAATPQMVIAEVDGYVLGGGLELALACDLIISSDQAVYAMPETGLGLIPGFGGTFRLARAVGQARARELIFTGRQITADQALNYGIVHAVVPRTQLREEVLSLAQILMQKSAAALASAKWLLQGQPGSPMDSALAAETAAFSALFEAPEARLRLSAFTQKPRKIALRNNS